MTLPYKLLENIADPVAIPGEGILSRTVYDDDQVRAVLFGFAPGEELSEHTASMPAIIHILHGEAKLTLDGEAHEAGAGAWVHMAANLPHSVHAKTPVALLLYLLKS
ncbi:MAG: cupin domain-containing protein [Anaerolineaceae bacterium]|nr:cupin domain-containing protein [Anaerolineaceae bacterium]